MKKLLVMALALALVLVGSLVASAADLRFSVDGGYQIGWYNGTYIIPDLKSSANGFVVNAEASYGLVGAKIDMAFLSQGGFKVGDEEIPEEYYDQSFSRMAFLGSITAPIPVKGLEVKALGGYQIATASFDLPQEDGTYTIKAAMNSPAIGAQVAFSPIDKLTFSGNILYGIGVKPHLWAEYEGEPTGEEVDAESGSALSYEVKASYQIVPPVGVEVGFRGMNYSMLDVEEDCPQNYMGVFFGARASF